MSDEQVAREDLARQGEPLSEASLYAAMDAFYSGEDWRNDLGCALESSLCDMKAALLAGMKAAPAPSQPAGRGGINLRAKAKALLDRLDTIHADPAYISVWTVSQLHVGPYRGPTYITEADALHAALRDAPRDGGDGTRAGWKLVPEWPTVEMIHASTGLWPHAYRYEDIAPKASESWRSMFAAAPSPNARDGKKGIAE